MVKINIEIDGKKYDFDKGITIFEVIKDKNIKGEILVAKFNNKLIDLSSKIEESGKLEFLTFKDPEGLEVFRHSSAHLMAHAVKDLYPSVKLTIGPVVDDGFYYDFDLDKTLTPEDLVKIEKKMKELVHKNEKFIRKELSKKEALELFRDNEYKLELIKEYEKDLSFYYEGDFFDLCRGPHVPSTRYIQAFKLTKVAGAYWRADAKNKQLQRVYGISFPDKKLLNDWANLMKEAERRDHRKIGKQMDLFSIHEEAPGMPFFHNNGTFIFNKLVEYMREEMGKRDYEENKTPIILNKDLWLRSGHWDHYKENMYFTKIDKNDFAVKPINCPGNLLIYKTHLHSYKELPIKAGEFGLVHRHELSGVLAGLFRVRVFTQDDAHVFCMEEQLQDQIIELIELVDVVYSKFGFKYDVELSTKPEKAMGSQKIWDKAESALKNALETKKIKYKINPGDGAFYGPKIDYHVKDAIGRTWQCGTIQLDFSMPEKFDLLYEGADGKKHRPVMLHRAIYGSLERFMGILIEHFAGKFPLWLSPVQVKILTIADRLNRYAGEVAGEMKKNGLNVKLDLRTESISRKVRDAQLENIPLIIIIGDKEVQNKCISVRTLDGNVKYGVNVKKFIKDVNDNVKERKILIDFL